MKPLPIIKRNRKVIAHAQVDDDLYPYLSKVRWHDNGKGYPQTAFKRADGTKSNVFLHSVVFRCKFGRDPLPGLEIDHIDRNPLNAQRSNLREFIRSYNTANSSKRSSNTSGCTGVTWHKRDKKWLAQIKVNGQGIFLGYHTCIHAAARAVNRAYEKYFPGIAIPNPQAEFASL